LRIVFLQVLQAGKAIMMASLEIAQEEQSGNKNMKYRVACATAPMLVGAFSYQTLAAMHLEKKKGKSFPLFINGFELTSTIAFKSFQYASNMLNNRVSDSDHDILPLPFDILASCHQYNIDAKDNNLDAAIPLTTDNYIPPLPFDRLASCRQYSIDVEDNNLDAAIPSMPNDYDPISDFLSFVPPDTHSELSDNFFGDFDSELKIFGDWIFDHFL
jgi:hypothetical protein